jgi:hypothetical protein
MCSWSVERSAFFHRKTYFTTGSNHLELLVQRADDIIIITHFALADLRLGC